MKLTKKQIFVLQNFDRIIQSKRPVSSRPRYDLDGEEVDSQVRTLVIKDFITKSETGELRRTSKQFDPSQDQPAPRLQANRHQLSCLQTT